jgi:hypothetical protein
VETQRPDSGSDASEGKISRGWRLTQVAWKLIRHDRTMLALAAAGVGCAIVFTLLVFYFGGYFSNPQHPGGRFGLIALIAFYPSVFVSVFFNVALACAASAAFDGCHMSVGEALRIAYGKVNRIALWSLLTAVIGMVISEIANRLPGGAKLAGWLLGAAWGLATIFVVPILAMESTGAIDAVKRSARLVKSRWGEGLSGGVAIGAWSVVVAIPLGVLIGIGGAMTKSHPETGIVLLATGMIGLIAMSVLISATRQVFAVALYRYSIDAPIGGFSSSDLAYPFTADPSRKKRKSWILRIGVPILALFAVLAIVAAIVGPRHTHTAAEGYFHIGYSASQAPSFSAGAPVVYKGRQIGEIVSSDLDGGGVQVVFRVDPRFAYVVETQRAYVAKFRGREYLRIGTAPNRHRGSPDPV